MDSAVPNRAAGPSFRWRIYAKHSRSGESDRVEGHLPPGGGGGFSGRGTNDRTLDQADAQFLVGATYTLSGSLSAFVTTQTGNTSTVWLRDSMGGVSALDTAHCHVWSEDPAVTIKSGSGATYTPPAPAAPSLAIRHDGGDIVVSWPAAASGFRLFASPSLSPAEWTEVTVAPGVDGDRLTVPLRPEDTHRFFRLQ